MGVLLVQIWLFIKVLNIGHGSVNQTTTLPNDLMWQAPIILSVLNRKPQKASRHKDPGPLKIVRTPSVNDISAPLGLTVFTVYLVFTHLYIKAKI